MSEEKHTPGPWVAYIEGPKKNRTIAVMASSMSEPKNEVVHWAGFDSSHVTCVNEREANARLIARAPELLSENAKLREQNAALMEALQACSDEMSHGLGVSDRHDNIFYQARTAPAKAREQ